jgi:hypothetical protein
MCSCQKNKNIKSVAGEKGLQKSTTVSAQSKGVKKTREELLAELRRRISLATR